MSGFLKKTLIIAGIILVAGIGLYSCTAGMYNGLVQIDEEVNEKWSQVQNLYQERFDKIPNLVATVKGYAKHEESVFAEIAQARAKAGGVVNVDSSILEDDAKMAEFQQIQDSLGASLQRLLVVSENYPTLKADRNFLALQDEISEIENKISLERKRFNDSVKKYNTKIRSFPTNIVAGNMGLEKKAYFEAVKGSETAPKVEF